jgi:hypothetical protein
VVIIKHYLKMELVFNEYQSSLEDLKLNDYPQEVQE